MTITITDESPEAETIDVLTPCDVCHKHNCDCDEQYMDWRESDDCY